MPFNAPEVWLIEETKSLLESGGRDFGVSPEGTHFSGRLLDFKQSIEQPSVPDSRIRVATVPSGSSTHESQLAIEAWVRGGPTGAWPQIDMMMGPRLLLNNDNVAIFGSAEQISAGVPVVLVALWLAKKIHGLEFEISTQLEQSSEDLKQADGLTLRGRNFRTKISQRCVIAHDLKRRYMELSSRLNVIDGSISSTSLRIFREIDLQFYMSERLLKLHEKIDYLLDFYTDFSDRIIENGYFRTELVVEVLILIVLLADLLFLKKGL